MASTEYPELEKINFSYHPEKSTEEQAGELLKGLLADCEARLEAADEVRKAKIEQRKEAKRVADAAAFEVRRKEEERRRHRERMQLEIKQREEDCRLLDDEIRKDRTAEASGNDSSFRIENCPEYPSMAGREKISEPPGLQQKEENPHGEVTEKLRQRRKKKDAFFYFPQSQDLSDTDTPAKPQSLLKAFLSEETPIQVHKVFTPLSLDKRVRWDDENEETGGLDLDKENSIAQDSIHNTSSSKSKRQYGSYSRHSASTWSRGKATERVRKESQDGKEVKGYRGNFKKLPSKKENREDDENIDKPALQSKPTVSQASEDISKLQDRTKKTVQGVQQDGEHKSDRRIDHEKKSLSSVKRSTVESLRRNSLKQGSKVPDITMKLSSVAHAPQQNERFLKSDKQSRSKSRGSLDDFDGKSEIPTLSHRKRNKVDGTAGIEAQKNERRALGNETKLFPKDSNRPSKESAAKKNHSAKSSTDPILSVPTSKETYQDLKSRSRISVTSGKEKRVSLSKTNGSPKELAKENSNVVCRSGVSITRHKLATSRHSSKADDKSRYENKTSSFSREERTTSTTEPSKKSIIVEKPNIGQGATSNSSFKATSSTAVTSSRPSVPSRRSSESQSLNAGLKQSQKPDGSRKRSRSDISYTQSSGISSMERSHKIRRRKKADSGGNKPIEKSSIDDPYDFHF